MLDTAVVYGYNLYNTESGGDMITIVCDSTKKAIPNAERDVNYVTILDKTLSMPALEQFEAKVREKMGKEDSYSFARYKEIYRQTLSQVCK